MPQFRFGAIRMLGTLAEGAVSPQESWLGLAGRVPDANDLEFALDAIAANGQFTAPSLDAARTMAPGYIATQLTQTYPAGAAAYGAQPSTTITYVPITENGVTIGHAVVHHLYMAGSPPTRHRHQLTGMQVGAVVMSIVFPVGPPSGTRSGGTP